MKPRLTLWFIILITLFAFFIDLPKLPLNNPVNNFLDKFPLKLGLDLQGGSQLILGTDMRNISESDQDSALESVRSVIEKRVNLYGVSEALVQSSRVGSERRILVELPGLKDATAAANLVGKTAKLEFRELSATTSADFTATGLTGADLTKAQVTFGGGGGTTGPVVSIEFTDKGAEKFANITKINIGRPLAIFLDDELISAPVVQQEIIGGSAIITGQFTTDEAKTLAVQLNAGALPVPIKILEQRSIGPSLGLESLQKSLAAGVIGLFVVCVYMISYYGKLGLIADLALIIYSLIVLAIFKTGLFVIPSITLTLAGIAGFILSVGMAVDANILVFERMKEELRWGKSKVMALEFGFNRAWSSIWASNISSLITASILYGFGTSIVKGFAITLAIGVLVSMFTAIIITRTFLKMVIR